MLLPEMGELFNRTNGLLTARFDGQDFDLQPGMNTVPKVIIPYAKGQLVLMGSEDPMDPSDFISLVGVPGKDDCSPLEQNEDEPTRAKLADIVGEGLKIEKRGRKKRSAFQARFVPPEGGMGIMAKVE